MYQNQLEYQITKLLLILYWKNLTVKSTCFWYHASSTAGLSWEPIYRDLPELRQVFKDEVKHKERNEYQKSWVRKKHHKGRTLVLCKQCLECFIPKRSTATFCSSKCRLKYHLANKSPIPSSVKDLEVYFDSNRADWYKDKSF